MAFLRLIVRLALLGLLAFIWLMAGTYLYLSPKLPNVEGLRDVHLQTPMRVYTRDGELIGQFGEQKRSPLAFEEIPQQFIDALLAAEDDNFFRHKGIDVMSLLRAVSELVLTGEKGSGGSTLTMQVARNFFLSKERTFIRKFNEILLAIEIERRLEKREILELYFNRMFLGHRAYGFQAAAQVYYGKSIADLDLAQHAMLAGIPKAPSRKNPITGPEASKARRNWILGRMQELGYIDATESHSAMAAPVTARHHGAILSYSAHYAAEMVRGKMVELYGQEAYTKGFHVYTTISGNLQQIAREAVINGLLTYDARHGYRGPEQQLGPGAREEWLATLAETPPIVGLIPAVVTQANKESATVLFADDTTGELPFANGVEQAQPYRTEDYTGPAPKSLVDVLAVGDLIRLRKESEQWYLTQVPEAQAALVSLDPSNGAIRSIVGGMGFELSKFNRATQAFRQPGSSFKPFLYSAALDAGFTAATLINDAPVVLQDNSLEDVWRPENDGGKFYGPTRLRWALTKSRNLVSIRLLQQMGVRHFIDYAEKLGFDTSDFAPDLSLALGTQAMSPMELATGYAVLANGGYRIEPFLIERVEDLEGNTVYRAEPLTVCHNCLESEQSSAATGNSPSNDESSMEEILAQDEAHAPTPPPAPRVMDARVNFIIDSMLKDVIRRGTGHRAQSLGRNDIAGKTGTTNGPRDAWFSGYNPDVVTITWVGFDSYKPLGKKEFGGTAALPIWIEYMAAALEGRPENNKTLPPGIVSVRIDPQSGQLASARQPDAIFEYFLEERAPKRSVRNENYTTEDAGMGDLIRDIF